MGLLKIQLPAPTVLLLASRAALRQLPASLAPPTTHSTMGRPSAVSPAPPASTMQAAVTANSVPLTAKPVSTRVLTVLHATNWEESVTTSSTSPVPLPVPLVTTPKRPPSSASSVHRGVLPVRAPLLPTVSPVTPATRPTTT